MAYLWVALGGALGSVARFACSGLAARWVGVGFPWGTLFVNVAGSFVIGLLASLAAPDGRPWLSADTRAFVVVGVLGGFTTFSSFSLETLTLARNGSLAAAGAYVVASVVLCVAAASLGFASAAVLNR
jgi:CrcB protein